MAFWTIKGKDLEENLIYEKEIIIPIALSPVQHHFQFDTCVIPATGDIVKIVNIEIVWDSYEQVHTSIDHIEYYRLSDVRISKDETGRHLAYVCPCEKINRPKAGDE